MNLKFKVGHYYRFEGMIYKITKIRQLNNSNIYYYDIIKKGKCLEHGKPYQYFFEYSYFYKKSKEIDDLDEVMVEVL